MQLSDFLKTIKGRYGREYSTDEDALFTDDLLTQMYNEAHRKVAEIARCYQRTSVYTIPLGSAGVSTVSLACDVIDVDRRRVRWYNATTEQWIPLTWAPEHELYDRYGDVLDNATLGDPLYFWFQVGDASDAQRQMVLYPGRSASVTDGLRVREDIYPALMTQDTHAPAVQPAEIMLHLPHAVMWRMAELERARGRPDAPVEYLEAQTMRDAYELKAVLAGFIGGGQGNW
jgi:hypothetical protein